MSHECPLDGCPSFGLSRCYYHLKERLRGEGRLSVDELGFIGMSERPASRKGWRSANTIATSAFLESILSEEDTAFLQSLMRIGADGNADFLR